MSGHSKWATIKHKKGAADKARGKLFAKLIRQVEVAAREGGGDLDSNANLRTMYQKARDNSVPLDTIERAIKRGTGELEGVSYEQVSYEGYAPHGVAMFVDVLTDNRNRTGAEIRSVFTRAGGSLAEPGAVAWQFERKGVVLLPGTLDEDDVMLAALEAGAEDVVVEGDEDEIEEEIDLDEIIAALTEEEKDDEKKDEVAELKSELDEHRNVVKYLKSKLNEVNLLNAKLLFTNKLFRSFGLTNDQKMKVVETFDRATNLREVKLVYSTLAESFGTKTKTEIKESKGSASKAVASTKSEKQEEILTEGSELRDRFKKLAGIKI